MKFFKGSFQKGQDSNWNQKFECVHIFREVFGHTNVPQRFEHDPSLGAWVAKQRNNFSKSKLSRNRQELLEKINFDWAPGKVFSFNTTWDQKYQELKYFKAMYGHCNVPCIYSQNKELGFWVKNQRQYYRKKILDKKKIFLLNQIGFEFIRRNISEKKTWKERFRELLLYFERYGDVMVPQRSGALGKWVQKQRDLFRKKKIKQYRKDLLDTILFVWNPRKKDSSVFPGTSLTSYPEHYQYLEDPFRNQYSFSWNI